MYDFLWDAETNGIILTSSPNGSTNNNLRPVYHDELNLLGFDMRWEYPKVQGPLLWNQGRDYYYKGELVATTQGGGFFEKPHVTFHKEKLKLVPVNIEGMKEKNSHLIEALSQHAEKFILKKWSEYKEKVDISVAAISGGKDSVVLLNLVRRALSPHQFHVVYSDTTMELSSTYKLINDLQILWPELDYHIVRADKHATQTWREFGPPSRIHRWCCTVHKTVPNFLLLRRLVDKPKIKAIVFDGVRRDESQRRAQYLSVAEGNKHFNQINVRPIINWNAIEVYLYILFNSLPLNKVYRIGLNRVGCSVCPFSSPWADSLKNAAYPNELKPFLDILDDIAKSIGVSGRDIQVYIQNGNWATRAGGRNLVNGGKKVLVTEQKDKFAFSIRQPNEKWQEWIKVLGDIQWINQNESAGNCLLSDGSIISFKIKESKDGIIVETAGINNKDKILIKHIRAIANKTAYCVHCGACMAECPTGALRRKNSIDINESICTHCGKCLDFSEMGCIAAKSLRDTKGGPKVKRLDRYHTFGLRAVWLEEFFMNKENWWTNNSLGNKQIQSMRVWLNESGLIEGSELSILGKKISKLGSNELITWAVIWLNLARNSNVTKWYLTNLAWGESYDKKEILEMLGDGIAERTKTNAINALFNMLNKSPLGMQMGIGKISKVNKSTVITKKGWNNPDYLSILYALYFYAEIEKKFDFTVGELFRTTSEGPCGAFGITKDDLCTKLRGISQSCSDFISIELIKDLDNIYLNKNKSSLDVLDI